MSLRKHSPATQPRGDLRTTIPFASLRRGQEKASKTAWVPSRSHLGSMWVPYPRFVIRLRFLQEGGQGSCPKSSGESLLISACCQGILSFGIRGPSSLFVMLACSEGCVNIGSKMPSPLTLEFCNQGGGVTPIWFHAGSIRGTPHSGLRRSHVRFPSFRSCLGDRDHRSAKGRWHAPTHLGTGFRSAIATVA
jgi:hypothetical protein